MCTGNPPAGVPFIMYRTWWCSGKDVELATSGSVHSHDTARLFLRGDRSLQVNYLGM